MRGGDKYEYSRRQCWRNLAGLLSDLGQAMPSTFVANEDKAHCRKGAAELAVAPEPAQPMSLASSNPLRRPGEPGRSTAIVRGRIRRTSMRILPILAAVLTVLTNSSTPAYDARPTFAACVAAGQTQDSDDWLRAELRRLGAVHCLSKAGDATDEAIYDAVSLDGCDLVLGVTERPEEPNILRTELRLRMANFGEDPSRVSVIPSTEGKGRVGVRIVSFDLPPLETAGGTIPARHVELFLYEEDTLRANRLAEALRQYGRRCAGRPTSATAPSN